MTVLPPTEPPWVRPEILRRYAAGDPEVTWESLSSQEQAICVSNEPPCWWQQ